MHKLRALIIEIHRRSLWQVLGVFLAASWGVLQVVEVVAESVGLPDWTQGMAFVLLLLGLPVVLATAFVQEGIGGGEIGAAPNRRDGAEARHPSDPAPTSVKRLFTWRNALLGGLGAFTLLGISLVAYFAMWTAGIGPVGNLAAQGVFEEGEPVVLAEFANTSDDASLGGIVTEALRVDLASSRALTLLPSSRVDEVLGLMGREPADGLPPEVAREVATRAGVKAVIEGAVGSAGTGYILVATLRATDSGDALATFRRTARSAGDVIDAIDGLSQDIREKAGESLRTIKAEAPLDRVTTSSLDALRRYSEAEALSERGEYQRAKEMLQEAVALDPGFAMAWRKLAVVIQTAGGAPGEEQAAATRAYELRDRLTERERGNAVAYYHNAVTGDRPAWIAAYESLLEKYPDDPPALNNLAIAYTQRTRQAEALALLERAIDGPGESAPAHVNYIAALVDLGRVDEARAALGRMEERYPSRDVWNLWCAWAVESAAGDAERAHELALELARHPDAAPTWRGYAQVGMAAFTDAARGRLAEAREHQRAATATSRSLGHALDVVTGATFAAALERIAAGNRDAAAALLSEGVASEEFRALPPLARPWEGLAAELIQARALTQARDFLDLWAREGGVAAGTTLSEARLVLDALSRPTPQDAIAALEAFRTQTTCPHCWSWTLAELNEDAGELERAAELYADAMHTASSPPHETMVRRVVGHERLGDLYTRLGDQARAAEHYRAFAEAWADADAEVQPRVRRARRLAEEQGSRP